MRYIELFEKANDNFLYHSTNILSAAQIISSNVMLNNTEHNATSFMTYGRKHQLFSPTITNKYGRVSGVSLTRSFDFAKQWGSGEAVVLRLDGAKLRQRYKLVPIDYYHNRREAEEFVPNKIENIDRYLTGIFMPKEIYDYAIEYNETHDDGFEVLTSHPLLKII